MTNLIYNILIVNALLYGGGAFKSLKVPLCRTSILFSSTPDDIPQIIPQVSTDPEISKSFKGFGKKKTQPVIEESVEIKSKPIIASEEIETEKKNGDIEKEILSTKMFKNIEKKREEALNDKIQKLREEEELIASDPSVGAVPELIANRMIGVRLRFRI